MRRRKHRRECVTIAHVHATFCLYRTVTGSSRPAVALCWRQTTREPTKVSGPAIAAALMIQHAFELTHDRVQCRDMIENYAANGGQLRYTVETLSADNVCRFQCVVPCRTYGSFEQRSSANFQKNSQPGCVCRCHMFTRHLFGRHRCGKRVGHSESAGRSPLSQLTDIMSSATKVVTTASPRTCSVAHVR
jgi:hypothetical protein